MEEKKPLPSIFIVLLVGLLVVFTIFIYVNKEKLRVNRQDLSAPSPVPTVVPTTLSLNTVDGRAEVNRLSSVTFEVTGDSNEQEIVGYDVLVAYDKDAFDFVRANSLLTDFSVVPNSKDGYVAVTAFKNIQSQNQTVLKQTPILRLTFRSKKEGSYTFSIKSQSGKEKTKLVNNKTEVFYPNGNVLKLEVK